MRFSSGPLLRQSNDLDDPGVRLEQAYALSQARLVFANHALLQHDFPQLSNECLMSCQPNLCGLSPAHRQLEINRLLDQWLLEHGALISQAQLVKNEVHDAIPVMGPPRNVLRPRRYGRAMVVPLVSSEPGDDVAKAGLLDLKGTGVGRGQVPSFRDHSSGLCHLGETFSDYLYQWICDEVFQRAAPHFFTVPLYGIIYTGFSVLNPGKSPVPMGISVRRAHRRPKNAIELPKEGSSEELVKFEIEMVLRRYGLTSATVGTGIEIREQGGRPALLYGGRVLSRTKQRELAQLRRLCGKQRLPFLMDGINVQIIREHGFQPSFAQLVDFGHYRAQREFSNPVASLVRGRLAYVGAVLRPDNPYFIQPNPRLALPYASWGEALPVDPIIAPEFTPFNKAPQVVAQAFLLARQFALGQRTGPEVFASLKAWVHQVSKDW